jgi:hypothetical protein
MDGRVDIDNLARALELVNALPTLNFQRAVASLLAGRVYVAQLTGGYWIAITAAPGPTFVTARASLAVMMTELHTRPRRVRS